jgi:hypothetical protein
MKDWSFEHLNIIPSPTSTTKSLKNDEPKSPRSQLLSLSSFPNKGKKIESQKELEIWSTSELFSTDVVSKTAREGYIVH